MEAEALMDMSNDDLRAEARSIGVKLVKGESQDQLRVRVMLAKNPELLKQLTDHTPMRPQVNVVGEIIDKSHATEGEVRDYVESLKNKRPKLEHENGLRVKFQDDCWFVRCFGAEDSGTMKQPLNTIKQKIESVSQGALRPAKFGAAAGDLADALSA